MCRALPRWMGALRSCANRQARNEARLRLRFRRMRLSRREASLQRVRSDALRQSVGLWARLSCGLPRQLVGAVDLEVGGCTLTGGRLRSADEDGVVAGTISADSFFIDEGEVARVDGEGDATGLA